MTKEQLETRNQLGILVNIAVFLFLAWRITDVDLFMYPLGTPILFLLISPFIILWAVAVGAVGYLSDWTFYRRSRLDTLRTALEFYASYGSYESEEEHEFTIAALNGTKVKIPAHGPWVLNDKGKRAREALEACKPPVRGWRPSLM